MGRKESNQTKSELIAATGRNLKRVLYNIYIWQVFLLGHASGSLNKNRQNVRPRNSVSISVKHEAINGHTSLKYVCFCIDKSAFEQQRMFQRRRNHILKEPTIKRVCSLGPTIKEKNMHLKRAYY